ncbi:VWA domain-containing protein [Flavobacterium sp. SUN052]|uniref:vWA domain-containing protein n=1 Tax=Flavobacterium sp. SUN052 TaxID=3002441 RepID=UPI00237EC83D|nr:VWA domain-containing protein [Flavobacterium sp. SUN052]MEC4004294.1 VWA domain-containing protein [Flavobacterium sp. SUN052]
MFELEEKNYLYLMLIIPILVLLFLYVQYWKRKKQLEFGDLDLIKKLSPEKSVFKPVLKFIFVLLGLTCLIIALVNPKMGTKIEKVKRQGIDIVFAIDVSKSMLAEDVAPNRLEKSKQIVSQIINQLGGDKIGIIAYSGSAFPVLPMTSDYAVGKMFLQSMNPGMISSQGTSIDQAIDLASTNFFNKKDKTNKLLIIISDGEDHSDNAESAAEEAQKLGLKIITIGVGTEKGGVIPFRKNGVIEAYQKDKDGQTVVTKRNATVLAAIAKASKGGYVDGNSTKTVIDYIKKRLDNTQKSEFEGTMMADLKSQFQWFLGFGFFFLFVDVFMLEKRTKWVRKMNLFNEEKE